MLIQPLSTKQMAFNELLGAEVICENGDWEPLIKVTQEDLDRRGIQGTPHEGRVPLDQFLETGVYQVPRHEDDCFGHVQYADFRADPESCPVVTPSGKLKYIASNYLLDLKNWIE